MIRIAVAAEDGSGAQVIGHVIDTHLCSIDWIEREHLDDFRCWHQSDGQPWLALKRVGELCRERFGPNFRLLQGHFQGEPGSVDALLVRKTLALLAAETPPPDLVIVARDDDHPDRRRGIDQAVRDRAVTQCPVVVALAQPEVEAWFICTWQAESDQENDALAATRQLLGFDPVSRSHELTSTADTDKDCKQVLGRLVANGRSAWDRFADRSLEQLVAYGATNGLAEFVRDCRQALDNLTGHRQPQ